ncbi:54S ribosomal protein l4, mitochondrial [Plakobranchus ocellatus]|uniref:54S ribosomal protein l4, mitochondrial n=1 Tax=Plakobranchus ocellatus TaxID=259542 RepID=A0AAV4AMM6_9GAST|nr:54S ribosomal protein l4, mitochondrial [Plakobranchus ocellatus]
MVHEDVSNCDNGVLSAGSDIDISVEASRSSELSIATKDIQPPQSATSKCRDVSEMAHPERARETTLSEEICSWHAVIYLLLHFSFITLNLPRSTTNMAFVCVDSKRREILAMANASGLSTDKGQGAWATEMAESINDNRTISLNRSLSVWNVHGDVMNDIHWDSGTKGLLLSAAFFLSSIGPILFDAIRQKISCRYALLSALLVNAILMFLSPELARISPHFLLVTQALLGLTLGANAPVVGTVLPNWTPEKQSLTASAITYAGYTVGTILSTLMNGFLCSVPVDNGWPFIYYNAGCMILIYSVAWFFFMSDTPETHRFISEREKAYILATRSKSLGDGSKSSRPPYLTIFRSLPVLTYIYVYTCFLWSVSIQFVYMPIYLSSVHGFSVQVTGVICSLMFCARCAGSIFWTAVGNTLTNKAILTSHMTRKACICTGLTLYALASAAVAFFDREDKWIAIGLLVFGMMNQSVSTSHLSALPMELAPRYSGTIVSINLSASLLFAISGPMTVAVLTPTGSYEEWRLVWYILCAVSLSSSIIFLLLGQAKLQPWAATDQNIAEQQCKAKDQTQDTPQIQHSERNMSEIIVCGSESKCDSIFKDQQEMYVLARNASNERKDLGCTSSEILNSNADYVNLAYVDGSYSDFLDCQLTSSQKNAFGGEAPSAVDNSETAQSRAVETKSNEDDVDRQVSQKLPQSTSMRKRGYPDMSKALRQSYRDEEHCTSVSHIAQREITRL